MKIILLDNHDIAVTLAEGREPVLAIKYHRTTQKLVFGTASGRVVIADMVRSAVIHDFRTTNGPVWGLAFLSHASSLVVTGFDDYFIAISLETISPGDNPLGMSDTKQRRFHPNTKTMGNGEPQFARKCSVCHSLDPYFLNNPPMPSAIKLFSFIKLKRANLHLFLQNRPQWP